MSKWRQNFVRLAIGSAATGLFLWLFLRIAHVGDAWKEIKALPAWAIGGGIGFVLASCALAVACVARAEPVVYDWFEYTGHDAVFEQPLPPGHYRRHPPAHGGFARWVNRNARKSRPILRSFALSVIATADGSSHLVKGV